jgi:hypothetical protein
VKRFPRPRHATRRTATPRRRPAAAPPPPRPAPPPPRPAPRYCSRASRRGVERPPPPQATTPPPPCAPCAVPGPPSGRPGSGGPGPARTVRDQVLRHGGPGAGPCRRGGWEVVCVCACAAAGSCRAGAGGPGSTDVRVIGPGTAISVFHDRYRNEGLPLQIPPQGACRKRPKARAMPSLAFSRDPRAGALGPPWRGRRRASCLCRRGPRTPQLRQDP